MGACARLGVCVGGVGSVCVWRGNVGGGGGVEDDS